MRNLNGYSKKILLICSILFLSFSFINKSNANEFTVLSDYYHVWDGNTVNSTIYLTITTESPPLVIKYYTVTVPDENITPRVYLLNRDTQIEPTIHRRNSATDLVMDLENIPLSKDKPIKLKIEYSTNVEGKSLSLLSSILDTNTRTFSFRYPSSLGKISWSSSPITKINTQGDITEIFTAPPKTTYFKISLGDTLVYSYKINRNLINVGEEMIISEVSLPVNNSNQHLLIESIQPTPDKAYKDTDGNYILQYGIAPESSIDVKVDGYLFMNSSTYPLSSDFSIEENKIWKITDSSLMRHINRYIKDYGLDISDDFSNIETLTKQDERELLHRAIYSYVIENLEPNTLTVGSLTGSERLNGQDTLIKQDLASSEAYADSLITIYRYFNIPARLVIGYISDISNYSQHGMYHYWAEYFDYDKNDWVQVDPFLEDYSKTSLWKRDMKDHISLIYRYSNPNIPKLTYYTETDFEIEKVEESPELKHSLDLSLFLEPFKLTNPYVRGSLVIKNNGNTVLDMFKITKSNPDLNKYIDYIENNSQVILLPGDTYKIKFNIPTKDIEEEIFAIVDAYSGTEVLTDNKVEASISVIKDIQSLKMLSKLLSILIFIICIIPIYFISKKYKEKKWITK